MKRLTKDETMIVKGMNLKPENWTSDNVPSPPDEDEVFAWCEEHGVPSVKTKKDAAHIMKSIEKKFFPKNPGDGFDGISLEDIAGWVLTTYLTRDDVLNMTEREVIDFLQDWKYFFGFRKCDGMAYDYKMTAIEIFDGALVQNPKSKEIEYIDKENV